MRSAEKHLTHGRIDAAISEYRQIVDHDPKDITTQNMLGDLYVKAAKIDPAVDCYRKVANHYHDQGFAKKAIAVYNKIHKIKPGLTDIIGKLAELYQQRGSVAEARSHYRMFAERLEKEGKNIDVLEVWQKIADMDTADHEICLKIAESQKSRHQKDEACKAFYEAACRLAAKGDHPRAAEAYENALKLNDRFGKAVGGLVSSLVASGKAAEAARLLETRLEEDQYNRDLIFLLIDCHFELSDPRSAEKVITKLVEREPANYPKLLDLVEAYLRESDAASAARVLSMMAEHLLAGGDARTLESHLLRVIEADPANLEGLRLLARCYGWQRKQAKLRETLEKLADAAREAGAHADEKWSLSQYLVLVPHDSARNRRFEELVSRYGSVNGDDEELLAQASPADTWQSGGEFGLESEAEFAAVNGSNSGLITQSEPGNAIPVTVIEEPGVYTVSDTDVTVVSSAVPQTDAIVDTPLGAADEVRLDEELVSIRFYIDQGYDGLADKALTALHQEFGNRAEIADLRQMLTGQTRSVNDLSSFTSHVAPAEPEPAPEPSRSPEDTADPLGEIASDLGLNVTEVPADEDFEEHYNHGVAYKEMGLIEDAIREFQTAAECVERDERSRDFYNCCTILGHCFIESGMPKLALIWYRKAYDRSDLTSEESLALEYELGNAYELFGNTEDAVEHFERVYASDVSFRDVSRRLESLREAVPVAG